MAVRYLISGVQAGLPEEQHAQHDQVPGTSRPCPDLQTSHITLLHRHRIALSAAMQSETVHSPLPADVDDLERELARLRLASSTPEVSKTAIPTTQPKLAATSQATGAETMLVC